MSEFDNALVLTTPHERGQRVRDAQYLMQGHGAVSELFPGLACYKDGKVDGDFGLLSAQAAARTKWWLGFPQSKCDPTFGQVLYNLLTGQAKLTKPMQTKRRERLAAKTPGEDALALLKTLLYTKESPAGSNRQMFGAWYAQIMGQSWWNGVPWCAETESYCFWHTGYKRYIYASVENIYNDALAYRNGLRIVSSPQIGDVTLYSIGGERYAHTAFFDGWIVPGQSFYDVGGNTGPSNISNGGEVLRQERNRNIVLAFVRVG